MSWMCLFFVVYGCSQDLGDPELITLVESDPFHGYETETVVAHLTKLNDIATLFPHDEKTRY